MRTCLQVAAVAAVVLWISAPAADAVTFKVGSGSFILGGGWGAETVPGGQDRLNVVWSLDASFAGSAFDLNDVGDLHTLVFGSAWLNEEGTARGANKARICGGTRGRCGRQTEIDDLGVTAVINMHFPLPSGSHHHTALVTAFTGPLADPQVDLTIDFASTIVSFGNGGIYEIGLSDLSFDRNGQTRSISATFRLLALPAPIVTPVQARSLPAPQPGLLLGVGLASLALAGGRKRHGNWCRSSGTGPGRRRELGWG